jgi:hypothetical protein
MAHHSIGAVQMATESVPPGPAWGFDMFTVATGDQVAARDRCAIAMDSCAALTATIAQEVPNQHSNCMHILAIQPSMLRTLHAIVAASIRLVSALQHECKIQMSIAFWERICTIRQAEMARSQSVVLQASNHTLACSMLYF